MRFVLLLAASALLAQTQTPRPVFTREGIVPLHGNRAKLLAPGMILELYGQHLAPEPWCGEKNAAPAPSPVSICGVQVLVGKTPADLLFVGPNQINLKIPADAPAEGSAPIQVCVRNVCSAPVTMRFSAHTAFVRLHEPGYVRMPVWLEIEEPAPNEVSYPCQLWPWSFEGYRLEVRRDGQELPFRNQPPRPGAMGSGGCWAAAAPSLLPLHLLYDFDQPGVYSVRFTRVRQGSGQTISQSDWTDITVGALPEGKRDEWLRSLQAKAKTASPQELAGYIIPSMLAWPDEKALGALVSLIPAGPSGCPGVLCDLRRFEAAALAGFDDALLRRAVPPDQLMRLCPPEGRCRPGK